MSRTLAVATRLTIHTFALTCLIAGPALAQEQSKGQQACIVGMNKAARGVAKAQSKEIASCIKKAASSELSGSAVLSCMTADLSGRVGKAKLKTTAVVSGKCATTPDFGYTDATTVNEAAVEQEVSLLEAILGDVSTSIIERATDSAGAKCQASVQKSYEKILQAQIRQFESCKKAGLKSATITSQAMLADCLDTILSDPKAKIGGAVVKLADTIAKSCTGVNMAVAFPGECSSPGFADCAKAKALCQSCLLLNTADDTGVFCDMFDNGTADASCVDPLRCGNGITEPGEDCDDGNNVNGDCCSATCTSEPAGQACADDGNVCTDNECDGAGACIHPNNTDSCDDGVFCNGLDTCAAGACTVHAGDPCTGGTECADLCDEAADNCFDPSGTACTDDGNDCTDNECDGAGACAAIDKPITTPCATDGNVCTDDECDGAGTCEHNNNTVACDDGLFCTAIEVCSGGSCVGAGDPCAGGSECADTCNEAADNCNEASGVPCTDDGNLCTDDECDGAGVCGHPNNTEPCTDGLFCNGADTCSGGTCSAHTGDPCSGGGECNQACNEAADNCFDANGSGCDDGDACTTVDQCDGAGSCVGSVPPDCDDSDVCTDDSCVPATGCENVFNGGPGCNPITGPSFPPDGGTVSFSFSGTSAANPGGLTVSFTDFTPDSTWSDLYWGPASNALPTAGLDGTAHSLTFSGISGTTATWAGTTSWTDPNTSTLYTGVPLEVRITITGLGATPWVLSTSVDGLDPGPGAGTGAVVDDTTSQSDFSANTQFLADIPTDGTGNFIALNDVMTTGGMTNSSFTGGFYSSAP
jgi:hypothetical protein